MKKYTLLLVLLVMLAACAPAANQPETPAASSAANAEMIALTDGLGRTVSLNGPAQRIVSLAPSNTEILYAVGAGSQVVGRDDFSNYPEEAASLPSVGGSMGEYNLEQIVSLKPDLVLAAEINTPEQVKALEDLGLTVYYLPNPTDFQGVYGLLNTVALLSGHEDEAAQLVEAMKARVAAVEEQVAGIEARPKVFYEVDGSDPTRPWTAGPGTFIDLLINKAGGQNIAAGLGQPWGQLSQEELLVQNPEVILLGDAAFGTSPEQVAGRAGWESIAAVQNGRIQPLNPDAVSRPGPRLVDALEELVQALHPQLAQ